MINWIIYAVYGLILAWHAAHYIELKGISKKNDIVVSGKFALRVMEMNIFLLFIIALNSLFLTT